MIQTEIFVLLLIVCLITIPLAMFQDDDGIVFNGYLVGVIASIILIVGLGCIAVITGAIQVWKTSELHKSLSTKCFYVGHEQKCGVFDIEIDEYHYVSDGNKLTVYTK